jgi:hypothetical protein
MARLIELLLGLLRRLFGKSETPPAIEPKEPTTPPPADPAPVAPAPDEPDEAATEPGAPEREESPMPDRPTLKRGSSDAAAIKDLQNLLNSHGESLGVDGDFGGGTEKAVKRFQVASGLAETGVVDAATWAKLETPKVYLYQRTDLLAVPMKPDSEVSSTSSSYRAKSVVRAWNNYGGLIEAVATELDLAPSTACAVLAIESSGQGFEGDRQVIRFENHIFKRYKVATFADHFKYDSSKSWLGHHWRSSTSGAWIEQHTKTSGQDGEYAAFEFACSLDDTAAKNSISMGAPQIMGFNSALIGYPDVQSMFAAFSKDERSHVLGLFDFIMNDARMPTALRAGDWVGFAAIYNGSGQKDVYGGYIGEGVQYAKDMGIP